MATEILRPNAAGDETNLAPVPGTGEENWEDVDEEIPDDGATYVARYAPAWLRDLHNIPDHSQGNDTINHITVYARAQAAAGASVSQTSLKIAIKSGTGDGAPDTVSEGDEETLTAGSWINFSHQWSTNPATGIAWSWDEIDKLQIGIALRKCSSSSPVGSSVTQVYVEVDYVASTPPVEKISSELGQGSDCLTARIETPTKGGGMKLWT